MTDKTEITQQQRLLAASFADMAQRRSSSPIEGTLCLLMAAQVLALSNSDAPAFAVLAKLEHLFAELNAEVRANFPAGRHTEQS